MEKINKIEIYYPFVFADKLDPRNIFTVGEQVIAEYVFAYNSRIDVKSGFKGIFSNVSFDEVENIITIQPLHLIGSPDGTVFSFANFCASIESSFKGTRHAPYHSILKKIECDQNKNTVSIHFEKIPLNLRFLQTVPDFSISDPKNMPMTVENSLHSATGPYYLKKMDINGASLKINPNYPEKLRANNVESVELIKYSAGETKTLIEKMNPTTHSAAYFFGYSLNHSDIENIKSKGYNVDLYPTEWVTYLFLNSNTKQSLKNALRKIIDIYRKESLKKETLGIPAYSIAPSGRGFSLSENEYMEIFNQEIYNESKVPITLATLSTWAETPFFKNLLTFIKEKLPNIAIEQILPKDIMKLFSKNYDVALCPMGFSHSDPLSYLSFMESTLPDFNKIVTKEQISRLSVLSDTKLFDEEVKKLELKIISLGVILPIAHFPGVVAYRNDFTRDEDKSFGWGIQAWSYHINIQE